MISRIRAGLSSGFQKTCGMLTRLEDVGAGLGDELVVADPRADPAFEDVRPLIVVLMHVRWNEHPSRDRVLDDRDDAVRRRAWDLGDHPERTLHDDLSRRPVRRGTLLIAATWDPSCRASIFVCTSLCIDNADARGDRRVPSILSMHMADQKKSTTPRGVPDGTSARRALEATRQRIAEAAFELHTTVGPAQTSISAVAERAGVQRHTVYHHFPDMTSLIRACTAHGMRMTGIPDAASWLAIEDPIARLRHGLGELYAYYGRTPGCWQRRPGPAAHGRHRRGRGVHRAHDRPLLRPRHRAGSTSPPHSACGWHRSATRWRSRPGAR